MKLLLEKGADVNVSSNFCGTALHLAVREGHVEIMDLLLRGQRVQAQSATTQALRRYKQSISCIVGESRIYFTKV